MGNWLPKLAVRYEYASARAAMQVMLILIVVTLALSCENLGAPGLWPALGYAKYRGPNGGPVFSFEGPRGWLVSTNEPRKDDARYGIPKSWSVTLLGPEDPKGYLLTALTVEAIPPKADGGFLDRPAELLQNLRGSERVENREDDVLYYRIDSVDDTLVNGRPAIQIVSRSREPLIREGRLDTSKIVSQIEMTTAVEGRAYTFIVRLSADQSEESKYVEVYKRAVGTLRFSE